MVYFLYPDGSDAPSLPDFEFDEAKSQVNLEKHGMDFEQAQALWLDPYLREDPARSTTEPRWMVIGMLDGRHWTAFITYRGEWVRIISVRRSRPDEVARYEDHGRGTRQEVR